MEALILRLKHEVSDHHTTFKKTHAPEDPCCPAADGSQHVSVGMRLCSTAALTVGSDPFTTSTEGSSDKGLSDARHSLICFALQRWSFSVVLLCRSWLRSEYHR